MENNKLLERNEKGQFIKGGIPWIKGKHPIPWNRGIKGICKPNSGSFKKGEHKNLETEFKKGHISNSPRNQKGYKQSGIEKEKRKGIMTGKTEEKANAWKGGLTNLQKLENIAGRKKPNKCELCGRKGRICFDHDHKTGKFRGWICIKCNSTLGMVEESTRILNLIIKYIKNNEQ